MRYYKIYKKELILLLQTQQYIKIYSIKLSKRQQYVQQLSIEILL